MSSFPNKKTEYYISDLLPLCNVATQRRYPRHTRTAPPNRRDQRRWCHNHNAWWRRRWRRWWWWWWHSFRGWHVRQQHRRQPHFRLRLRLHKPQCAAAAAAHRPRSSRGNAALYHVPRRPAPKLRSKRPAAPAPQRCHHRREQRYPNGL